jgi:chromosomal replication initiation ATPase DnaA
VKSRDILKAVADEHKLQVADLLSRDRFGHFVAARRQAILEMKAVGLSVGQIASIMNLSYDAALYHTSEKIRSSRSVYNARRWREKQAARVSA